MQSAKPAAAVSVEDLDESQREKLRRLLDNGQFGTAVKQVQLWFKGVGYEHAEEIVRQLT
ncbi:hypothetical protein ACL1B8_09050 [Corynebacterium striatum]